MATFIPYYKKERGAVIIRVIAQGDICKVISTGIKIKKNQWDAEGRKVINHPSKKLLNQKIQSKISELERELTKAEILGVVLTRDRVKRMVEGGKVTQGFYEHCEAWIQEKYSNPGTRAAAMSDLKKVHAYAPSLQFGDIDKRWLMKYERYVRESLESETNTVWKALKFVRTMLYDAQEIIGRHIYNPFEQKEYKMPAYVQPEKDGLYISELDQIEALLDQPHPVVIKLFAAKFLFMCYTGLRISDAKRYKEEEHLRDGERVVITSKKTRITTNLKLYGRLSRIIERLRGMPEKSISDDKFNQYLETIQGLIKFTRFKITSHAGRHTFGCLCAEMGLSEEETMELMGVKNKKVVRVYYKLRQPQLDRAADKLGRA